MSSKTSKVHLYAVFETLDEQKAKAVCERIRALDPDLNFSPFREQPSLNGCLEAHATGVADKAQRQALLAAIDDDWDVNEEESEFQAYGFNTKMMDPLLYYVQISFD